MFMARTIAAATCAVLCAWGTPSLAQSRADIEAVVERVQAATMVTLPEGREFRAVAPLGRHQFLVASAALDGAHPRAALHILDAQGNWLQPIPLPLPQGFIGSRIDRLVPDGDDIIAIGHVVQSAESKRGWILRIASDTRISASRVLSLAADSEPVNYYYGGFVTDAGQLVVAGRSDRLDYPGLGISIESGAGRGARITTIVPGGGAAAAGLRVGDEIRRIAGEDITQMGSNGIVDRLRGSAGSTLRVGVARQGQGSLETVTLERTMIRGLANGVIARLNARSLEPDGRPELVVPQLGRAGLQDITLLPDGRALGVGWIETSGSDGATFDQKWLVAFDAGMRRLNDIQIGQPGANSIAQRAHVHADGTALIAGGRMADPHHEGFVGDVTIGTGDTPDMRINDQVRFAEGPGRTDVFRVVTSLASGVVLAGGAFRSDDQPQFRARIAIPGASGDPIPVFTGCHRSYVWDMARSARDAVAVAGYCQDAQGTRRAALMWMPAPPEELGPAIATTDAPRISLARAENGDMTFDVTQEDPVMIVAPRGRDGVVTLTSAAGDLIDFMAVGPDKAALLEATLPVGAYRLGWAGSGEMPELDVMRLAMTLGTGAAAAPIAPEVERALAELGYAVAAQDLGSAALQPSRAMAREIAAYQISVGLPPRGTVDETTEISLAVGAAFRAETRATEAAELAVMAADDANALILPSRNMGQVRGVWRGDVFLGTASTQDFDYAGEWRLAPDGLAWLDGYGVLTAPSQQIKTAGQFTKDLRHGHGVVTLQSPPRSDYAAYFDENTEMVKGAVYVYDVLYSSGFYADYGARLVRSVPLAQ